MSLTITRTSYIHSNSPIVCHACCDFNSLIAELGVYRQMGTFFAKSIHDCLCGILYIQQVGV
jgi:hypothetical protein